MRPPLRPALRAARPALAGFALPPRYVPRFRVCGSDPVPGVRRFWLVEFSGFALPASPKWFEPLWLRLFVGRSLAGAWLRPFPGRARYPG